MEKPRERQYWRVLGESTQRWLEYKETDNFYKGGYIALGWNELGDLNHLKSTCSDENDFKEKIKGLLDHNFKDWFDGPKDWKEEAGYFRRFMYEIKKDDLVFMPVKGMFAPYYMGVVSKTDGYYFSPEKDNLARHRMSVKWFRGVISEGQLNLGDTGEIPLILINNNEKNKGKVEEFLRREHPDLL